MARPPLGRAALGVQQRWGPRWWSYHPLRPCGAAPPSVRRTTRRWSDALFCRVSTWVLKTRRELTCASLTKNSQALESKGQLTMLCREAVAAERASELLRDLLGGDARLRRAAAPPRRAPVIRAPPQPCMR
jgi:hypothetical protein